jgi:hypothetical protein
MFQQFFSMKSSFTESATWERGIGMMGDSTWSAKDLVILNEYNAVHIERVEERLDDCFIRTNS